MKSQCKSFIKTKKTLGSSLGFANKQLGFLYKSHNSTILNAYEKFNKLNQQYVIERTHEWDRYQEVKQKGKGNVNKNGLKTQDLHRLENKMQSQKADLQLGRRGEMNKNTPLRNKKKFAKLDITYNQPYLKVYRQFEKELPSKIQFDVDSEQDGAPPSIIKQNQNGICFFDEVKKCPNLLKMLGKKLERKRKFKQDNTINRRKGRSLTEVPQLKNQSSQKFNSTETQITQAQNGHKITQNKIQHIFRAGKTIMFPSQLLDKSQSYGRIVKKQKEILASKQSKALSDKSRQKMKEKFSQIIREFRKSDSRQKRGSTTTSEKRIKSQR